MTKKVIILFFSIFLVVVHSVCYGQNRCILEAQRLLKKGKCTKAIKILENCSKTEPQSSAGYAFYLELGNAYYLCNNKKKAFLNYRKGFKLNSRSLYLCESTARAALDIKEYEEAARFFNVCAKLNNKKKSDFLFMSAYAQYLNGKPKKALAILENLNTDPDRMPIEWLKLRLNSALKAKKWDIVEQTALSLIDKNPLEPIFWKSLAIAEENQNKPLHTIAALDMMQFINDQKGMAYREILLSYCIKARLFRRAAEIMEGMAKDKKNDFKKLFYLYLSCGKTDAALDLLNEAFETTGDYSFLVEKGKLLIQNGNYGGGIKILENTLKQQRDILSCKLWLAIAYIHKEDFGKAQVFLYEASKACKNTPEYSELPECKSIGMISSALNVTDTHK